MTGVCLPPAVNYWAIFEKPNPDLDAGGRPVTQFVIQKTPMFDAD